MVNDSLVIIWFSWWLIIIWLVVALPIPLKNDGVKVSWDDEIPFSEWKILKFHGSKPPTSTCFFP
jgi:hypothetical protein